MTTNNRGFSSLMIVLFMTLVATLVIAVIQSRLLLAIYRHRSLSDTLVSTYNAESHIYDIIEKILGFGATPPVHGSTMTLPDGTELEFEVVDIDADTQSIAVIARRPFAVNKIELTRSTSVSSSAIESVDVMIALDCTTSMAACADGTGGDVCTGDQRIKLAKQALVGFLEAAKTLGEPKLNIGISLFRINAAWFQRNYFDIVGNEQFGEPTEFTKPTNDYQSLINAIEAHIPDAFSVTTHDYADLGACAERSDNVWGNTSIGTGLGFMHEYFETSANPEPTPERKQIELLITDGLPNSRVPYTTSTSPVSTCDPLVSGYAFCPDLRTYCWAPNETNTINPYGPLICGFPASDCEVVAGYDTIIPNGACDEGEYCICGSVCKPEAVNFLGCTIKNNASGGVRHPDRDLYSVTVFDLDSTEEVYQLFDANSTKFYPLGTASNLPETLEEIFEEIVTSTSSLSIRRVIP